jgi:hypothetical protein
MYKSGISFSQRHPVRLLAILLLLATLVLAGCSTNRLAYRNADWLLQRAVNSYVDLKRDQSAVFARELQQHLAWHCSTQLPAYVDWLHQLEDTALTTPQDHQAISQRFDELEQLVNNILVETAPSMGALLKSLDDQQVHELTDTVKKKQREFEKEYTEPTLARQIDDRVERLEDRLKRWLGRMTPEQRTIINAWSQQRGDQNQQWLASRQRWQQEFLERLRARDEPDFESRFAELTLSPARLHPPEWAEQREASRESAVKLFSSLLTTATPQQQQRLQKSLASLRRDFIALSCNG